MKKFTWVITGSINVPEIDDSVPLDHVKLRGTFLEGTAILEILKSAGEINVLRTNTDARDVELDKLLTDPNYYKYSDNVLVKLMSDMGYEVSRAHVYRRREQLIKEGKSKYLPREDRINMAQFNAQKKLTNNQ